MTIKKLLIVGNGDMLEQAVSAWSEPVQNREIVTAELPDGDFFTWDFGLVKPYPSAEYDCFVALGNHALSMGRVKVMTDLKQMGYKLPPYISPRASVALSATIGENCFIADGTIIGPSVTVKFNSYIGPRTVLGQGTKIGHSAWLDTGVITGPRVQVGNNSTLGLGITVRAECKIGNQCEITKVMDITRDIPHRTFYHPMFETEVRIYAA